jgi:hypothetical protein
MNPMTGLPMVGSVPTATPGVPTANLLALLGMQQQGMGLMNQPGIGLPGSPMMPGLGGIPGISMMPAPDLAAHMMQTFTPKPEDAPCVIFVGNLIAGITGDQLKQFFGSPLYHVPTASCAHPCAQCLPCPPVPFRLATALGLPCKVWGASAANPLASAFS